MRNIHLRKIVSVLLAILLMSQGLSIALAAGSDTLQVYRYVFEEQKPDGSFVQPYYMDMNGNRVPGPQPSGVSAQDDMLPTSYDARTQGLITPTKNQKGTSSCWAFATIACMETSMIKQGYTTLADTDYSEAYMAWFGQRQRTPDTTDPTYGDGRNPDNPFTTGGNWQHSCAAIMRGSGVQLESNAPWIETRDTEVMMQMAQPESDRYLSYGRVWQTRMTNDLAVAKQMLLECGALYSNYYDDTGITNLGYNKTNYCYYQNATTSTNHAVAIVGWDDNFPASNFNANRQPEHNGAWLVKGSWGPNYGNQSYYWLSYDDPSNVEYVAITAVPADIYDNIYQYDGALCGNVASSGSYSSASMANLFRAKGRQYLTHVAAFNPNYNTTVKAQIYTGSTSYTLSGNNPTNNMTLRASKTVRNIGYGYVTIELAQPILLEENQAFTVMITLTDPEDSAVSVPLEGQNPTSYTGVTTLHGGNVGESFIKVGSTWIDTNNYNGSDYNNVPVKAMTRNPQTPTLTLVSAPAKLTYSVGETLDTTGLSLSYRNEAGTTSTVTNGFTCSPTALDTIGTQTVTVTYNGLTTSFDVTVQPHEKALSVAASPTKTEYLVGDTLDTSGLVLAYTDEYGVTSNVTNGFTCTPTALTTIGTQTVTVTYNGLTASFDVTVQPYETTLAVAASPTKTEYLVGETLDTTGLVLTYTNEYGDASSVTEGFICTPTMLTTIGTQTVTAAYNGLTASFDVTVQPYETTLTVAAPPVKTEYTVGQTLDTTGLVLAYTDEYGVTSSVTEGFTCSPTLLDSVGTQTVTVSLYGRSTTFDVTVSPALPQEGLLTVHGAAAYAGDTVQVTISADANPGVATMRLHVGYDAEALELTDVQNGEIFDSSLFTPGNDYTNNPFILIWMDALGTANHTATGTLATLTFRILDTAEPGETPITMTLDTGSTFNIDLHDIPFTMQDGSVRVLESEEPTLTVLTAPTKMLYMVGETLDTAGLTLSYRDERGAVSTVTDGFVCTPTALNTIGMQTVTVTYGNASTTFDVAVQSYDCTLTVLTAPTKTTYLVGETLDTAGLSLSYRDEYGVTSTVTDGFVCTPTALDTVGEQIVTVSYNGLTTTFNVQVSASAAAPILSAETGSTTVIDHENGMIYGLSFNLSSDELDNYLHVEGGSYRVISGAYLGTGSQIQILNTAGEVVSTYRIVIFGDVDGDGVAMSNDIQAIKAHMNGADIMQDDSPYLLAADVDGDGSVDMMDILTIKGILTGALMLDQATRRTYSE